MGILELGSGVGQEDGGEARQCYVSMTELYDEMLSQLPYRMNRQFPKWDASTEAHIHPETKSSKRT